MIRSSSSRCMGIGWRSVQQHRTGRSDSPGLYLRFASAYAGAMSPAPLTDRQKAILDFFAEFQRTHGYPPTHREIRDRFGYTSYGTVHKHLRLLREKGYLAGE